MPRMEPGVPFLGEGTATTREGVAMNCVVGDTQLLMRWEPRFLRILVCGDLDFSAARRLLSNCSNHLDAAPFQRVVVDLGAMDECDLSMLKSLARGFRVLSGAGAEIFVRAASTAVKDALAQAGVLREIAGCGIDESDVETFVARAAERRREGLASENAQAEAPRRWQMPSWSAASEWLSAIV
ncbi:MAG: STAS domain-containing protein [Armatimonadetes bacterium]|nr:STAS domain-containing protein [Armatimonadota bacterium]